MSKEKKLGQQTLLYQLVTQLVIRSVTPYKEFVHSYKEM